MKAKRLFTLVLLSLFSIANAIGAEVTNVTVTIAHGINSLWVTEQLFAGLECFSPATKITLTVLADITNNNISADQTICEGQIPAALTGTYPSGGNGTYVFLWESSTVSPTEGFSSASGQNNLQNYTPGSLASTTWYRRVVTSDIYTNTSATVSITVINFNPGSIGNDQTICEGDASAAFTSVAPTGDGLFTYQWQSSTDGVVFTNIGEATAETYVPGVLINDTWFRRNVTSTLNAVSCIEETNVVKITAINFNPGSILADQTICEGNVPVTLTSISPTGDGSFTCQWQESPDGSIFTNIAGATDHIYTPGILTADTWYRKQVTATLNAVNCAEITAMIKITVNAIPATPVITREGDILTSNAGTGNQWYLDDIIIPGATGQSHTAIATGDYYVIVTQNGCVSVKSNIIIVSTLTSVKETPLVGVFDIYPNPNSGRFIIRFESFQNDEFNIEILNSKGVAIRKLENLKVDGIFLTQFDMLEFSPGTYLVVLSNKTGSVKKKIIITR